MKYQYQPKGAPTNDAGNEIITVAGGSGYHQGGPPKYPQANRPPFNDGGYQRNNYEQYNNGYRSGPQFKTLQCKFFNGG